MAATAPGVTASLVELVFTDFEWYCANCLKVQDKRTLRPVPFVLKPAQKRLAGVLMEKLAAGEPIRVIVLKARRQGMSTLIQAFFFWRCSNWPYQHSMTIAHDQRTTSYLHGITERLYRYLPKHNKPMKATSTRGTMMEFRNHSKREDALEAEPGFESSMQTTSMENAAAGFGILWLHLSEVGRWHGERGTDALTTALQTVPHEPGTAVLIESTAQGVGNEFHSMWILAESAKSDYVAFFAPWWEEPTYTYPASFDFERTPEEDRLAEIASADGYVLTDDQFEWRRRTIQNECRGKLAQFHQEYPSTAREAFLTSGRPFFDQEAVEDHRVAAELTTPKHTGDVFARTTHGERMVEFVHTRQGNLRLWDEPDPEERYVIFADCAAGDSDDGDFQCAYVLPRSRLEIVAAWHGRVDRDLFADILEQLGYLYNRALIAAEISGGWGASVVTSLRKEHYPNLYRRRGAGDKRDRKKMESYGWETTAKTRAEMLDALEEAIREEELVCNDPRLLEECRTFAYCGPGGKPMAQEGCHDDCVMAAAGAVYLWLHEPRPRGPSKPRRPRRPISSVAGY